MSEKQTIEQKYIGFHWKISINKEVRIVTTVSKTYPDKVVYDAEFSGNTETLEQAKQQISDAKKEIDSLTAPPDIQPTEEKKET